jgi:hypothetical protein
MIAEYAGGCLSKKSRRALLASLPQSSIGQKRIAGQKLNREDYGVDKYWVLLAVVKE